ncbi:XdhC family protein [Daejeonella lutea]|uniref:Xanthine and CO dehydrogenase maturation factor, XdhC/CoxF family n=1 Tax=Daejeonella lutea TaxID=572036 RepID=A0A1T4ZXI5_9SPHI|nr:XdhC family protein [Daejeonella lutea]SKB27315.1 Xanthine and CO dehydrogenase maturation factor, XdhC/CoxF family [Daejeonella lutea]
MKEIKAIIKAYNTIPSGTHAALATVVRVEGSSYRRTGARMLVFDDGTWIGGISGGCLEGDALKRARLAINNSRATLITYDTTEDDPHQIGVGLGCNGVIDVLFTPLDLNDKNNPVEILKSCLEASRDTHVLLTITALEGNWDKVATGDVIRYKGRDSLSTLKNPRIETAIFDNVLQQIAENKSAPAQFSADRSSIEIFIEILPPEISVVLMGHQYDVYPMSRLLKELDWRVSVCGDVLKINPQIRNYANTIIPASEFSSLTIDEHTAIVLMSHDYKTDKKNLLRALQTRASFIGMLGPRVRSERIWKELAEEGNPVTKAEMDRIHAPVGLDIGAVTPEEIALSLAAGIKAAFANRNGNFLKFRETPIHPRT